MSADMEEPIAIRVDNRIYVRCGADEQLAARLRAYFTHRNPLHAEAQRRGERKLPPEHISTWRWAGTTDDRWLSLPRGKLDAVLGIVGEYGRVWELTDACSDGAPLGSVPPHLYTLRPYQEDIVSKALKAESGIIRAGTGAGKTTTGFAIASRLQLTTLVVVWSDNLLRQWRERCETELGLTGDDVGLVQGKTRRIRPITLAMQQTLAADPEWCAANADTFGVLIADELQRFAAPTLFASIDPFAARYRVGISADETRPDKMEFLIYDLFGGVAADYPAADLVKLGAILSVQLRVVPTDFRAGWYVGARKRGAVPTWQMARLAKEMSEDKARNALVTNLVAVDAAADHQVLVWAARREQCHELDAAIARAGVLGGLLVGGTDYAKRFKETRDGIKAGRLRAGVGTVQSVGQAQDMPGLSRGVIAVPLAGRNRQQISQCKGRLCRLGTDDAACYYLWDRHVYGAQHLKNLVAWFGADVVVQDGAAGWVPGAEYIRAMKAEPDGKDEDDTLGGLFT